MKKRSFNAVVSIVLLSTAISFADQYTIPINAGYNLIANPLDHGSNTLEEIFGYLGTNGQDGLVLSKYNNGSGTWTVSTYNAGSGTWGNGNSITLNPGEGAFLQSPTSFLVRLSSSSRVLSASLPASWRRRMLLSRLLRPSQ